MPESDIKNGAVVFTLVTDHVFEHLAELYGIQNKFKDGVTKYIVCVSENELHRSNKIRQSMKFRNKPAIVKLEWFIDSMENCQL